MKLEWLTNKVTVAEAENDHIITSDHNPAIKEPIVFGFIHDKWKSFISQLEDKDELWEFLSEDWSWGALCGRAGYSIVRDGNIINSFITELS